MIAIGIDIGGTSIKGAAVYDDGRMLDVFALPVIKGESGEVTVNKLIDVVENYIKEKDIAKEIVGIGMGIPGLLDIEKGIVTYSPNLKWDNLPIADLFKARLPYPVRIANDANVAAFGEAKFGAGKGVPYVIMLTLGTGVGSGIIMDNKIYDGHLHQGAEIGHMVIRVNGEPCGCGRRGCLETYASATALIRDTKRAMEQHKESKCWEIAEKLGKVDARVAFEAERAGDEVGHQLVENYVKYLAEGLMNYFNVFRPEALILSGGIANEGEYLLSRLRAYLEPRHYGFQGTPKVELLVSELGYDSGKIGAGALFF